MKLATFGGGKVGRVEGDRVVELDVATMRQYFERGGEVEETGADYGLSEVKLEAPIIPKKFFHTAGNYQGAP